MEYFSLEYALLSIQSALLSVVTPELRAVVLDIDYDTEVLYIRYYYHGEVSEQLIDVWDCSIAEIDIGIRGFFDAKIERLDYPNPIPVRGRLAYLRKAPSGFQKPTFHMEECTFAYVMLAVQNVLLGVVTSELRSVVVDFDEKKRVLYIRFYYHGKVSEEIIELWNCAITEVFAAISENYTLDEKIERIDYPKEMPFRGRYAYLRRE